MNLNIIIRIFLAIFILISAAGAAGQDFNVVIDAPQPKPGVNVDEIINQIEKRYAGSGFSARFQQESTLQAMEITDYAAGNLLVKHPGKMRWEYETKY